MSECCKRAQNRLDARSDHRGQVKGLRVGAYTRPVPHHIRHFLFSSTSAVLEVSSSWLSWYQLLLRPPPPSSVTSGGYSAARLIASSLARREEHRAVMLSISPLYLASWIYPLASLLPYTLGAPTDSKYTVPSVFCGVPQSRLVWLTSELSPLRCFVLHPNPTRPTSG